MNAAGLSRAVFIGHALGGAIALTLAIDHPERVAGIGLISSGPRLPIASSVLENAANPATFILAIQSLQELMHIPQAARYLKDQTFKHLSLFAQRSSMVTCVPVTSLMSQPALMPSRPRSWWYVAQTTN